MVMMRKSSGLVVVFFLLTAVMNIIPTAASQDGDIEWFEEYSIQGNCSSSGNVEHRFWVNRTVVEIDINVSWPSGYGADINFWLEDSTGYNVDASEAQVNPETMNVREFRARGRWKLVLYPYSCGSGTQVNYTANITVRHIVLPEMTLSTLKIQERENVTINVTSSYRNVTHFFIDFGDGTNSSWTLQLSHIKSYNESGDYKPRLMVRYSDGTESDWVEFGEIEVRGEEEVPNLFPWVAFWLIMISLIAFIVSLRYDKKRGF